MIQGDVLNNKTSGIKNQQTIVVLSKFIKNQEIMGNRRNLENTKAITAFITNVKVQLRNNLNLRLTL